MKPFDLKVGVRFRVAHYPLLRAVIVDGVDAWNREEILDEWTAQKVTPRETRIPEFVNPDGSKGKTLVTGVLVDAVRASDGVGYPLFLAPWVELTVVEGA